jgi:plastocyanin
MRKLWIPLAAVALALGFVGVAPAGAKTTKPVTLDGKVNNKGTKNISGKKSATLDLEADDYYFKPTFVKVSPGEKVTIEMENEGGTTHTFTSDGLGVDQQLSAGKKKKFTVTVPSSGKVFQFHCSFHGSMGMQGALYTKAGGSATNADAAVTPTTKASSSGGSGYGY